MSSSTASSATLLGASAVSLSVASEWEWGGGAVAPALPITPSSCPSLSGQLLRQSLSRYLRTQVVHAHSAVVLFGFNAHDFDEDEDIPIRVGARPLMRCNSSAVGQRRWQTIHSLTFNVTVCLLLLLAVVLARAERQAVLRVHHAVGAGAARCIAHRIRQCMHAIAIAAAVGGVGAHRVQVGERCTGLSVCVAACWSL